MSQDSEISWPVLRRIVKEWAGGSAELAEVTPLDGGCISTTVALTLVDQSKAVLKISAHRVDRSYEREAHQLTLLRNAGLPVPNVYVWKTGTLDDPFSYILMEFVEGVDWAQARKLATPAQFDDLQIHLADLLRCLHAQTAPRFCRAEPDGGEEFESWPEFYKKVYEPIWRGVEKSSLLSVKERKLVNRLRERLDRLIANDDVPRLMHGDLWSSNLLVRTEEGGRFRVAAFLDPDCKFAHAEVELAYLELFQTVGPCFMKAYQRDRKLTEDYHRFRKPVYQLHSLINHVHHFGDQYAKPLAAALERVSALV
jgi:fructosamine-3-kinase